MKRKIIALFMLISFILPLALACKSELPQDGVNTGGTSITDQIGEPAPPIDTEPNAVIFASADFQGRNSAGGTSASGTSSNPNYNNGNAVASAILKRIIQNMQNDGYTKVDATVFCGDYDIDNGNKASDSKAGIDAVKAVYTEMGWDTTASGAATPHVFVQGNHEEKAPVGTNGLSGSNRADDGSLGVFDTESYGLYLLHEDYHPFKNSGYTDEMIDSAAAELKEYLDKKLADGYSKPVFIAAHVPLHHNLWMHSGLYAKPFFDVINEAAGNGLNIIYLFGHDHGGYDQYIGGTDIFLPAGSAIIVPDRGTKTSKQTYPLNFTYMSAGLSAYVAGDHSENQLSGTVFEVYDDRVVIKRYNDSTDRANNGLTNVGNVGEERADNTGAGLYHTYYPKEYNSPQTVNLGKQTEITDQTTNVSVKAFGIASLKASAGEPVRDGSIIKLTFNITPALSDGTAYNGYGTLTLPLPSDFGDAELDELYVTAGGRRCAPLSYENGMLSLWVPDFAPIEINYTPKITVTCKRVRASELESGKRYLIVAGQVQDISSKYNGHVLSPDPLVLSSPERVGLAMRDIGFNLASVPETLTVDSQYLFTFNKDASGSWTLGKEGQYLQAGSTSGSWASSGDGQYRVRQLKYGSSGTLFDIKEYGNGGMVYISTPVENGKYPCCLYVTSYGNSCLMDIPKAVEDIRPSALRISFYYIYEVQE